MPFYKNTSSQKIPIFAWDIVSDVPATGIASEITGYISLDCNTGTVTGTDDVNPTELSVLYSPGFYFYDMTQAESNADVVTVYSSCGDDSVRVDPVMIYTDYTSGSCINALNIYDPPTNTEMENRTILSGNYFDYANDTVAHVTLVDTTTENTDMRGTNSANTTTPPTVEAIRGEVDSGSVMLSAISGYTDSLETLVQDIPTNTEFADRTIVSGNYLTTSNIPTTGNIADAVWEEAIADHTTSATFGGKNQKVVPSETINDYKAVGFSTHSATDVRTEMDAFSIMFTSISGDTSELQEDWTDTGRLDTILDSIDSRVSNLTAGTAAINTTANNNSIVASGIETLTYESTQQADLIYHEIAPSGGNIMVDYQFDVGGNGVPVSVTWLGYAQNNGDSYVVNAYNYATTGYDQIGNMDGSNGTSPITNTFDMTTSHVGTGTSDGEVKFQITSTDGTNLATDRVLCSYAVVSQSVGYAEGAIWYDDTVSNTNTVIYVDGVADNPVSSWTAVKSLISQLGIKKVRIAAGSTVTLDENSDNYTLLGMGWTLVLNGQSIEGVFVEGANVSGVGTATVTAPRFEKCGIGAVTLGPCILRWCGLGAGGGQFTAGSAGQFFIVDCVSMVPGSGSPTLDFSGKGSTVGINTRRWAGGATYTVDSDCTVSHEVLAGGGTTFITSGADIEIRGITRSLTLTFSAGGTTPNIQFVGTTGPVTMSGTAAASTTVKFYGVIGEITDTSINTTITNEAISQDTINTEVDAALSDYDGPTNVEMEARTLPSGLYTTGDGVTVQEVREEMDSASTMFAAISGYTDGLQTTVDLIPNTSEFEARTLPSGDYFDYANDVVARVTLVDTTTANTDMRGTNSANTTTPPTVTAIRSEMDSGSTMLLAISGYTDGLETAVADVPTVAEFEVRTLPSGTYATGDVGGGGASAADVRAEMDSASTMFAAISGYTDGLQTTVDLIPNTSEFEARTLPSGDYGSSDLTSEDIRIEIDNSSVMLQAISGYTDTLETSVADVPTVEEIRTEIDNESTMLSNIYDDTNELQQDWHDDGRLDNILDSSVTMLQIVSGYTDSVESDIAALNDPTVEEIRTEIDNESTMLSNIYDDTNELQQDWHDGGRLDNLLDQVYTAITGLEDISTVDIKTQVVAAISGDTYEETDSGAPVATASLMDKLGLIYKALRNKTVLNSSTGKYEIYGDDGTLHHTTTVADDGSITTRNELGAP